MKSTINISLKICPDQCQQSKCKLKVILAGGKTVYHAKVRCLANIYKHFIFLMFRNAK